MAAQKPPKHQLYIEMETWMTKKRGKNAQNVLAKT